MEKLITWGGNSGIETQPLPFVISGLVIFAFTSIGFLGLISYWNRQIAQAHSRFCGQGLRGFRILTVAGWVNVCLLPAIMMFYPLWTVRLVCIGAMGVYFLYFLYHNYRGKMQLVDPYLVNKLEETVREELKPAIEQMAKAHPSDEHHTEWANDAANKLDALIARLRGKDDATGSS